MNAQSVSSQSWQSVVQHTQHATVLFIFDVWPGVILVQSVERNKLVQL